MINHAGITFLPTRAAQNNVDYGTIVQAYIDADEALGASRRRAEIVAARSEAESECRQLLAIEREVGDAVTARLEKVGVST